MWKELMKRSCVSTVPYALPRWDVPMSFAGTAGGNGEEQCKMQCAVATVTVGRQRYYCPNTEDFDHCKSEQKLHEYFCKFDTHLNLMLEQDMGL